MRPDHVHILGVGAASWEGDGPPSFERSIPPVSDGVLGGAVTVDGSAAAEVVGAALSLVQPLRKRSPTARMERNRWVTRPSLVPVLPGAY